MTVKLASLLALFVLHASVASADNTDRVVSTADGPVSGTVSANGREFLGIPYAAPPIGSLRFKPPAAAQRWTTTRDATQAGSSCPQLSTPYGLPSTNEDCLFVNVYTPSAGGQMRNDPVLVWLHPGSFQFGEGSDFNPRQLVARNLVVVTVNYRLGALGFLSHPALTAEGSGSSGNYGFLDQQTALRWVQRNIAQFGGNPNNVTIAGQSAGAVSVHAHLVSPGSAGLFQQAIAESGAYALTPPTLAQSEPLGTAYAAAVGCSDQSAACLRGVPVATLLDKQDASNPFAYLPRVDGTVLPTTFAAAFASGKLNKANVLEGSTHDEFRFHMALFVLQGLTPSADTYPALIATILQLPDAVAQQLVPMVMAQYPLSSYASPTLALAAIGTDAEFACNTATAASLLSANVPTWWYEFDDPDAPQFYLPSLGFPYGASHGSELPYLFDVRKAVMTPALSASQQELSDWMVKSWANFARTGNPNSGQSNVWPQLQPATQRLQLLRPPEPQAYSAKSFATDHKCAFWSQLLAAGSGQ